MRERDPHACTRSLLLLPLCAHLSIGKIEIIKSTNLISLEYNMIGAGKIA